MTPEDKQLTWHAALAAGIRVEWQEVHQCFWIEFGQGIGVRPWDPLTDDGDALRLAVKLGITPMQNMELGDVHVMFDGLQGELPGESYDDHGGDQYAATRRVIVRAAATMWNGHSPKYDSKEIARRGAIIENDLMDIYRRQAGLPPRKVKD